MAREVKDDLLLFLQSRDPVTVSREWHVVRDRQALALERPRMSPPRRMAPRKYKMPSFAELRAERMLKEVKGE